MSKDFESLKNNVVKDINSCNKKELKKIYDALKKSLASFDKDSILKNVSDFFKSLFKNKKEKCLFFVEDICDSRDKLTNEEKESLRKSFLEISNIHRTFLEDILALLGAL